MALPCCPSAILLEFGEFIVDPTFSDGEELEEEDGSFGIVLDP